MGRRQEEEDPERVVLHVRNLEDAEVYYYGSAKIDRHNRCRETDLAIEGKFVTMVWSKLINMSLAGIFVTGSWLLHCGSRGGHSMKQSASYEQLA